MIRGALKAPLLPIREALHNYTYLCIESLITQTSNDLLKQYNEFKRFNITLSWTEFQNFPDYLYEAFNIIMDERQLYIYMDKKNK